MKGFIQSGDVLDLVAPAGGVVSGGVYLIGDQILAVAGVDAAPGTPFAGKVTGVFGVTKVGPEAWAVGSSVYWDDANARFTTDPEVGIRAGYAVEAAGASDTIGIVRLDAGARDGGGLPQGSHSTSVIRIPRTSVQAFHTTEVDLVAGQANVVLIPRFLIVKKETGAYTVIGIPANGLMLGWGSVADNIPAFPWSSSPAFGVLVAAGVDYQFAHGLLHNGSAAALPFGLCPGPMTAIVGKKLAMRSITASPAGAGGDLLVRLWYDAVPLSVFDLQD